MKPSSQATRDYEVGYGKPPQHSQFKPGHSGNPKGRTKGVVSFLTLLKQALMERVVVIEEGKRTSITKRQAFTKGLVNRAVKGDARAVQQLLLLMPSAESASAISPELQHAGDAAVLATLLKRLQSADAEDPAPDAEAGASS